MADVLPPTSDPLIKNTIKDMMRILTKPVLEKTLFSLEMLQAIAQDTKKDNSLASIWLATVCLFGCARWLRYNELANIKPCDLQINPTCMTIRIP